MKKLVSIFLVLVAVSSCAKKAPVVEAPKEEVKYEYSIGESLMQRMPVKYCHVMNGAIYVQMNDVLTFTTANPGLICIQQEL